MAKIMVFQHVPYEPLGTLDPLLRAHKHRVRYVNFGRNPKARPDVSGYDALIVLGGPQNIGQEAIYPHLNAEKAAILQAMDMRIPVLGICLGAQLIASAMGARVYPASQKEVGWYPLSKTLAAKQDSLFKAFPNAMKVFQWHGYTFELPASATRLVEGNNCKNQAFRIGNNVYGFQFHLEANLPLIQRWLHLPQHQQELGIDRAKQKIESIWNDTLYLMDDSLAVSSRVFSAFLQKIPKVSQKHLFLHKHY